MKYVLIVGAILAFGSTSVVACGDLCKSDEIYSDALEMCVKKPSV